MNFAHAVATQPVGTRFIAPASRPSPPSVFSPSTSRAAPGAFVALPSVFPPSSGAFGRCGGRRAARGKGVVARLVRWCICNRPGRDESRPYLLRRIHRAPFFTPPLHITHYGAMNFAHTVVTQPVGGGGERASRRFALWCRKPLRFEVETRPAPVGLPPRALSKAAPPCGFSFCGNAAKILLFLHLTNPPPPRCKLLQLFRQPAALFQEVHHACVFLFPSLCNP